MNLSTQFRVQKESMTGIAIAKPLPTLSFWVSVVQLQAPEKHVSFCISFDVGKLEDSKSGEEPPIT